MDKYEFNIKIEQIKKRSAEGDYETAMKIADSIDWTRVRNTNLLNMAAEVYEKNGEIEEAKDKLLLAFERAPIGRRLLYKLTELSVKSGDLEEAEDYYHEFADLAPDDSRCLLLAYMIMKAKNAPADELVDVLERYTAADPDEKWLYELAEAYDAAGRGQDCVRVCDKVKLLYGSGAYADKAMRLKQKYAGRQTYAPYGDTEAGDYGYANEDYTGTEGSAGQAAYQSGYAYGYAPDGGGYSAYENGNPYDSVQNGAAESAPQETAYQNTAYPSADTPYPSDADASYHEEPGYGFSRAETEDRMGDILANQRYENEDAAFEAYLQLHRMDDPAFDSEEKKQKEAEEQAAREVKTYREPAAYANQETDAAEETGRRAASRSRAAARQNAQRRTSAAEVMPAHAVGYEDDELTSGFAQKLSEEVSRIRKEDKDGSKAAPASEKTAQDDELGKTRILDENRIERLRKVVIRDDSFVSGPQIVARDEEAAKENAVKQAAALTAKLGAGSRTSANVSNAAVLGAAAAAGAAAGISAAAALHKAAEETPADEAAYTENSSAADAALTEQMAAEETKEETAAAETGQDSYAENDANAVNAENKIEIEETENKGEGAADALAYDAEKPQEHASEPEQVPAAKPQISVQEPAEIPAAKPQAQNAAAVRTDNAPAAKPQAQTWHMIIEAASAEEGLSIAKDELKYIHAQHGIRNGAIKTTAEKLNQKGLGASALEKIRGKDFLIEHAGSLSQELMDQVYDLICNDQTGMILVLIDVPEGLDRLEAMKPEIFSHCDLVSDYDDEYSETDDEQPAASSSYETASQEDERDAENSSAEETDTYENAPAGYADAEDTDDAYDGTDAPEEESSYDVSYEEENSKAGKDRPSVPAHSLNAQQNRAANIKTHGISSQNAGKTADMAGNQAGKTRQQSSLRVKTPQNYQEEMELDDFAQYCCKFASEIDCSITGKSMLALYERIELMEEDNIPLTRETAENLIEEAADRAEKPPITKRLKGMFHSKYDKNGLLILKEEDFID